MSYFVRVLRESDLYSVYKKTEQIWNSSQFRKTAISIQFLIYTIQIYLEPPLRAFQV
jgi:hypothetical protein